MKFESFLTLPSQQRNYHIHIVKSMWHQWLNCTSVKLQECFLCAKKTKTRTLFNNLFSSVSVFAMHSREYHNACMWCCWCTNQMRCPLFTSRGRRMLNSLQKHVWRFPHRGWPYLFEREYTDDELRKMDVPRHNAGSCVSSTALMRRGTAWWRLTKKRRHFWRIKLFSLRTESFHVGS